MIWIQNQLVGAYEGQQMTLECHSEAFPKSINYWTRDHGEIIAQSETDIPFFLFLFFIKDSFYLIITRTFQFMYLANNM